MRSSISHVARPISSAKRVFRPSCRMYATPVEYVPPKEPDPQLNGYPELPWINAQQRPPKGWWDVQGRRNFGETIHEEYDMLDMWSPDVSKIPKERAVKQLSIVALGFVAFGFIVYQFTPESPAIPRQYPFRGLVRELGGLEENKAAEESAAEDVDES